MKRPFLHDALIFFAAALTLQGVSWALHATLGVGEISSETALIISLFFWLHERFEALRLSANFNIETPEDLDYWQKEIRQRQHR